jgi:hypothetical protein
MSPPFSSLRLRTPGLMLGALAFLAISASVALDAGPLSLIPVAHAETPPPDATPADAAPGEAGDPLVPDVGGTAPTAELKAAPEEPSAAPPPAAPAKAEPTPWSFGLMTSMMALFVGGLSAVLGIWVDRDKSRPVIFAGVMSVLITSAICVGATQSYLDAVAAIQQKEDLDRMLSMVNEIAMASGDQSLADLVQANGGEAITVPPPAEPEPAAAQDSGVVEGTPSAEEGEGEAAAAGDGAAAEGDGSTPAEQE